MPTSTDFTPAGCTTAPDSCAGLPIRLGCVALAELRRLTAADPWWAVVSAVMHAGPVTYDQQQRYVERIAPLGPAAVDTPEKAARAIYGAQLWRTRVPMLAAAAKVYERFGRAGVLRPDRRRAFVAEFQHAIAQEQEALPAEYRPQPRRVQPSLFGDGDSARGGIGPKVFALLLEYLGDPDAVAADRHVANWACNHAGTYCRTPSGARLDFRRGDEIDDHLFEQVERIVRKRARACGVEPAALQVAAWLHGVCTSEARGRARRVFLGRGRSIDCRTAFHGQGLLPGVPQALHGAFAGYSGRGRLPR